MPAAAVKTSNLRDQFARLAATSRFQKEMDILWSAISNKLKFSEQSRSFLVCAAATGEGCTTVTMGLALFVAGHTEKNVLLMDAQLVDHDLEGLLADYQISSTIEEPDDAYSVTFREFATKDKNLGYLRFENPNAFETFVIKDKDLSIFMNQVKRRYDYVFCDAPPVLSSNVAEFLVKNFDDVIFVLSAGTLRYEILREAVERVSSEPGKILGVVLNKREYVVPDYIYRLLR